MSATTDWISAGANVAMAGVAFAALWIGRNYLSNLTNNDAYKLSLEIKDEIIPSIRKGAIFGYQYKKLEESFTSLLNTNTLSNADAEKIFKHCQRVMTKRWELDKKLKVLNYSIKKIEGYGWEVVGKKQASLDNIINNLQLFLDLCSDFDSEVDKFIADAYGIELQDIIIDFEISDSDIRDNYNLDVEFVQLLINQAKEVRRKRNRIYKSYDEFFIGSNYIGHYFKRKNFISHFWKKK